MVPSHSAEKGSGAISRLILTGEIELTVAIRLRSSFPFENWNLVRRLASRTISSASLVVGAFSHDNLSKGFLGICRQDVFIRKRIVIGRPNGVPLIPSPEDVIDPGGTPLNVAAYLEEGAHLLLS